MNILIIDDHQLFAAGLKHMLASAFADAVILCYPNPQAALDECLNDTDLIILDFYIPGFYPLDYIPRFTSLNPNTKLVVISSSVSATDRQDCLAAGAVAYFEKHLPPEVVLSNLQKIIAEPKKAFGDDTLSFIAKQSDAYHLGEKKMEVLILLGRGYSNKKMAARLGVSAETIKTHLSEIYQVLQLANREQARDWAIEHGFN